MSAALDHATGFVAHRTRQGEEPVAVTLLELVEAVSSSSDNESEVVATVAHMLRSGRVRLTGCLRDTPREAFQI